LATTEPELEDVLRALGASKLDIMRKVGIPRSLPYFFGSLKVAITLAFVGAVVSETVGSNKGIGKLMLDAQAAFQVPIVFAGLLVLAVMGIVLYAATAAIEARFTGWAFRGQASRQNSAWHAFLMKTRSSSRGWSCTATPAISRRCCTPRGRGRGSSR